MKHTKRIVAALILSAPLTLVALQSANAQQARPERIYIRPTASRLSAAEMQAVIRNSNAYIQQLDQMRFSAYMASVNAGTGLQPGYDPMNYGVLNYIDPFAPSYLGNPTTGFALPFSGEPQFGQFGTNDAFNSNFTLGPLFAPLLPTVPTSP